MGVDEVGWWVCDFVDLDDDDNDDVKNSKIKIHVLPQKRFFANFINPFCILQPNPHNPSPTSPSLAPPNNPPPLHLTTPIQYPIGPITGQSTKAKALCGTKTTPKQRNHHHNPILTTTFRTGENNPPHATPPSPPYPIPTTYSP